MNVLVAYASKHGATQGIAEAIAEQLRVRGISADAVPADADTDLGAAEAVVLGSAIYAGSWRDEAVEFARVNKDVLVAMPVWLFSSGPLGEQVEDEEEQPRQLEELGRDLQPNEHQIFFGALDRTKLGFGERMMVKAVKAPDGDFRDWEAIRAWADQIAAALELGGDPEV
jgi:menaquinone-dependent protoporphyrinogen oxidase